MGIIKNKKNSHFSAIKCLLAVLILLGTLAVVDLPRNSQLQAAASAARTNSEADSLALDIFYFPMVYKNDLNLQIFGVESHSSFYPGNIITNYTDTLNTRYVRMNQRISWRDLQPEEGGPINWDLLVSFETELRTLQSLHMTPVVIVDDYPRWATDNTVRLDGLPTSCGPLLPERYDDFAFFMQALVGRYSTPEFNAHTWELGNEPDVDPNLVVPDNFYGCWGDWDDVFYNGRAYGEMLKVVTPAVRAIDPHAQVWIGGLLLDSPNTIDDHVGQPEDFFRGILESGAAPYFDMVPYHAYINYSSYPIDQDIFYGTKWFELGGLIRGKARFLRAIMADYNVQKPLFVNETSQVCGWWCEQDEELNLPAFYDMQANLPARSFSRAIADGISGFIWYTIEGPGWLYGGLLDGNQVPKPVFYAYQTYISMIADAETVAPVYYGDGIEAYTFLKGPERIDIIFAIEYVTYSIRVPKSSYLAAFDRFGNAITPISIDTDYQLAIQYEPIYLLRTP